MSSHKTTNIDDLVEFEENIELPITNKTHKIKKSSSAKLSLQKKQKLTAIKSRIKRATAKKRISKFMKSTKPQRQSAFLNAICSDSGICIGFGKENKKIKEFFDGFSLTYANPEVIRIGSTSVNGFVNEISFERLGYKSHGILKSAKQRYSDNLFYEYIVGTYFINEQKKYFPCFVETYGCYKYKDTNAYNEFEYNNSDSITKKYKYKTITDMQNKLIPIKGFSDGLKESCIQPTNIAILIEHVKDARSLEDMLFYTSEFHTDDLVTTLFQIYAPLSHLKDNFTHYDLHTNNVMIFKPFQNGYIRMHYHFNDSDIISFDTRYIAKIIDYGSSFFMDPKNPEQNSKSFYDLLCRKKECNPKNKAPCGVNDGYSLFDPKNIHNYILTSQRNMSHDLRLFRLCNKNTSIIDKIIENIVYNGNYGTPEITENGFNPKNGINSSINNVTDAYDILKSIIRDELKYTNYDFASKNKQYYSKNSKLKKMGDLYVYFDGREMKYESI
jgi:hypothetical protein